MPAGDSPSVGEIHARLDGLYPGHWALGLIPLCAPTPHTHRDRDGVDRDCDSPGKRPLDTGWQTAAAERYAAGTGRDAHLAAIARHVASGGNVGLALPEGAAALDADTAKAATWLATALPDAPMQETARGAHYVVRVSENLRIPATTGVEIVDGITIDVRAGGKSQVVVEPSVHATGALYAWKRSLPDAPEDLPRCPPMILDRITAPSVPVLSETAGEGRIPTGTRNDTLSRYAGKLRRSGLDAAEIDGALQRINANRCDPPLNETEVRGIATSVGRYAPEEPIRPCEPDSDSGKLKFVTLRDLLARSEASPPDALVDGLLFAESLAALVAKPKAGKSTLARALALSVATGAPFLGRETRQGVVWYLALEDKPQEIARHLRRMGATGDEPIRFIFGPTREDAIAELRDFAVSERPALIVVDTLQRLARVRDLNDYAAVTLALDPILHIARQSGACVLLLHHGRKGEGGWAGDNVLGSTAILGSVDTLIHLRRSETARFLGSIQRYGDDLEEQVVELDAAGRPELAGSRAEHDLERAEDAVRSFLAGCMEPAPEDEIREGAKGVRRQHVGAAIRSLVTSGGVIRTGEGKRGNRFQYVLADSRSHAPGTSWERESENPNSTATDREDMGNSRSRESSPEAPRVACREQESEPSATQPVPDCAPIDGDLPWWTPGPADFAAWRDFRAALAELGRTDPERARLYLEGAACSLRDWTRSLRQHPPAPRSPGRNSGEPR